MSKKKRLKQRPPEPPSGRPASSAPQTPTVAGRENPGSPPRAADLSLPDVNLQSLESRSFDVYQRFSAFCRIIAALGLGKGAAVLDIGGYPGTLTDTLSAIFPDIKCTTLDVIPCDRPGYVVGSATALPFEEKSFDAVISSDTLEHLQSDARTPAIHEMMRVSRRWVIIGAPFRSPSVEFAEERVNALHQRCFMKPYGWLEEHIHNVLPEIEAVRGALEENGASVVVFPNGAVLSWFIMETMQILLETFPMLFPVKASLSLRFNRLWAADDDREPAYRHILVADATGALPPVAPPVLSPTDEEAVLKKLRALDELSHEIAGQILSLISDSSQTSPIITTRYIRQMEEIIAYQEREQKRLQETVKRQESYFSQLRSSFLFRILHKLKIL